MQARTSVLHYVRNLILYLMPCSTSLCYHQMVGHSCRHKSQVSHRLLVTTQTLGTPGVLAWVLRDSSARLLI